MPLRKWDIAWAMLDPAHGHEQAGRRPVLVYCNDVIAAAIELVAVLPITTMKKQRRVYPTEALLRADPAGLDADSLVLCHQLRTVATSRLSPPFGAVADPAMQAAVDRAVRVWLDLRA
jgi:mRNA-degrading endonuclease toxin of MazEF toxin-antitoxin module